MFCPNCGKKLPEGAAFCPECGNALRAAAPADRSQAAPATNDTDQTVPAQKKKKKAGLVVAISLFLLIAAAGTAGFVLWNNDNFRCWLDVREAAKMYEADDYERAVEAYQKALDRVEDSPEAIDGLLRVAESYCKEGNYKEALEIYDLILNRDPENQKALGDRRNCCIAQGEVALKKGRYDKALDYYKKALKINKLLKSNEENETIKEGLLKTYMGLGQESCEKGDYLAARDYYDDILAEADHDSTLYAQAKDGHSQTSLMLAMRSHAAGDYKTAETYYREILSVESVGRLAYLRLADLYVECGDAENAVTLLEEGTRYYADAFLQQRLDALRESLKPVYSFAVQTDANGNVYDLGGAEIYIYTWFDKSAIASYHTNYLKDYQKWAQDTYNFTMIWDDSGSPESYNDLADLSSGAMDTEGKLRFYMLPANRPEVIAAMKSNLIWNLSSLDVFDFSEHRFKQNGISDLYQINGDVFACSALPPEPGTGIFFNATLLEQITGITADDMYDLQEKGEWTWEKFEEICELIYQNGDINGDGVQDIYAVAGNTGLFTNACVYSNNTSFFQLGSDGKFTYLVDSPATREALEFQRKVRVAPYWYNNPGSADEQDYFYPAFDEQGKFVFLPDRAYLFSTGQRLNVNEEPNAGEYGFLMFPMGPNAGGQYINAHEDYIMAIPKCYTEKEAKIIAIAYSLWYEDVLSNAVIYRDDSAVYEAGLFHEQTFRTLARMKNEGAFIDTGALLPGVDVITGDDGGEVWDPSKSISQVIAEFGPTWKKAVNDYNKN